jgi:hypothetical protein
MKIPDRFEFFATKFDFDTFRIASQRWLSQSIGSFDFSGEFTRKTRRGPRKSSARVNPLGIKTN